MLTVWKLKIVNRCRRRPCRMYVPWMSRVESGNLGLFSAVLCGLMILAFSIILTAAIKSVAL
jgi:hypothetical protein